MGPKNCVPIEEPRDRTVADDVAVAVDCGRPDVRASQSSQINHAPGLRPFERVAAVIRSRSVADNDAAVVDGQRLGARTAPSSQVDHTGALSPHEWVIRGIVAAGTDDEATAVDAIRGCELAAQRTHVDHAACLRPDESVASEVADGAGAHHNSVTINAK